MPNIRVESDAVKRRTVSCRFGAGAPHAGCYGNVKHRSCGLVLKRCYHFATALSQLKPIQHALDGHPPRLSS